MQYLFYVKLFNIQGTILPLTDEPVDLIGKN